MNKLYLPLAVLIALAAWLLWPTTPQQAAAPAASFPTTLETVVNAMPARRQLDIQRWQTDAGSRVLFVRTEQLPMLDVRLVFDAGSARDGEHAGLASLTNAMLDQGADGLDVGEIARGFEDIGAAFGTSSHRDMALITLTTLSDAEFREPALALLRRIIHAPDFPEDALDRLRTQRLQSLRMQQQVPGPQLARAFNTLLFGEHPYAIPSGGTAESLPALAPAHLARFYQQYYTGANAVIALVGDITEEQARTIAEALSEALPQGERAARLPVAATLVKRRTTHIDFPSSQTHISLGNQLIQRGHEDYVPLYVGNHILGGGGFSAILMDEVRQKRGLVYGVSSHISPMASGGPFSVSLQTANSNADDALALTLALIQDFVDNGPTPAQLQLAIDDLTGSFALATASNRDIVGQLGAMGFYDLPLGYLDDFQHAIGEVTAEQIRAAFQRHLNPEHLAIASIGPRAPDPDGSGTEAEKEPETEAETDSGAARQ
ncbi:M16 family metallopeptidase [Alcanivorax quisquiliarum]|uniref:Insulinase family protein n=1 Tax=Alcanivorax quisquiliarum TaxID=2933565 RepID=A0ABT0E5D9_9GAMM|nr:pitrilysin family protein [Alcanivorax quisquiliarum]MCK0537024.1 insulinase family protein [Alcanivorax quisquiliarum]